MDSNASPSAQRYAPPTAEVADVAARGDNVLAGRGIRLGGAIIDTVILMLLFWLISLVTPLNIFSPAMATAGFFTKLAIQAGSLLLFAAVHGYLLATRGKPSARCCSACASCARTARRLRSAASSACAMAWAMRSRPRTSPC